MAIYYAKCINKHPTHPDPHNRIQFIGTNTSRSATDLAKKWTADQVVSAIERNFDTFYCDDKQGDQVKLIVATHNGHKYVNTQADGIYPDNLLGQRECSGKNW